MANSSHAARWIGQTEDLGWDRYLFPAELPSLVPVTEQLAELAPTVQLVEGWPIPFGGRELAVKLTKPFKPGWPVRAWQLARIIRRLKPDLVHSLEIQHAGYLAHGASLIVREDFPTWIVSNWGSDTYIFGRTRDHRERLRQVLSACDYYMAECERDIEPARDLGFAGTVLPVLPAAGGLDVSRVQRFRRPGPVSERRVIAVRGYHGWAGRSLVALRALERAADVLRDYKIVIYLPSPEVPLAVELVVAKTGLDVEIQPFGPHDDIWRLFGRARALVALSIGDGISTSMLEAITMGAFPIQSNTSCAGEWWQDGEGGILVEPEDPEDVERAIRRVVADDGLVDAAASTNFDTVMTHLDHHALRPRVIEVYERVAADSLAARATRRP